MYRIAALMVFAGGLFTSTTAAMAQSAPAAQSPPTAATVPDTGSAATPPAAISDADVVTCRYEKETGSLFTKRICHTKKEWNRQSRDAHDALDRLDSGAVSGQQSNAGGG